MPFPRYARLGFSLVELSIVLVILGLLVGGVLSGQSLIRAAQLRSVVTEQQRYFTAIKTFRDKYFTMPGDMVNATSFWGAYDGGDGQGSDCRGEESALLTCNGNGNGQLEYLASNQMYELHLFWKHLQNAQLIEGGLTGYPNIAGNVRCTNTSANSTPGCNEPASKVSGGMWEVEYFGTLSGSSYYFNGDYGNVLKFKYGPSYINDIDGVIATDEAWNIDQKIDDGKPATGNVVAAAWYYCTTAGSAADTTATYNVGDTTRKCAFLFRNQF